MEYMIWSILIVFLYGFFVYRLAYIILGLDYILILIKL